MNAASPKTGAYARLLARVRLIGLAVPAMTLDHRSFWAGQRRYDLIRLRLAGRAAKRAVLMAGLHGDERSGTEALCRFLEQRRYTKWLGAWHFTVMPCLNPWGYEHGTRWNHDQKDLNRHFGDSSPPAEVAFARSLFRRPIDLLIDLHEDRDSPRYYLYETRMSDRVKPVGSLILNRVKGCTPINRHAVIDGHPARYGMIADGCRPGPIDGMAMPIYARRHGARCSLTLEAGMRVSRETRVMAHLCAIEAALEASSSLRWRKR